MGESRAPAQSPDRVDGEGPSAHPNEVRPEYDAQLAGFHRAFGRELRQIVESLPLTPTMNVLDLACGDGFYTELIADRLGPGGRVTGADVNRAYLSAARQRAECRRAPGAIDFVASSFDRLPFAESTFDLVWCAQSLFSLPDPIAVLRHAARVLRPGATLAVLENDTIHQVFLPWPPALELPVRAAELRALSDSTRNASRYYIGRRLPAVFAAAGLEPLSTTTRAMDRQAPLGEAEQLVLQKYLDEMTERVAAHLDPAHLSALRRIVDRESPDHMLRQPHLSMAWLNVLTLGRKPPPARD